MNDDPVVPQQFVNGYIKELEARVKELEGALSIANRMLESRSGEQVIKNSARIQELDGELAEAYLLLSQARPAVRNKAWTEKVHAFSIRFLEKHKN